MNNETKPMKGDEPAFPILKATEQRTKDTVLEYGMDGGLTKREYFAAMAMQGLCASQDKDKYLVNDGFLHYESLIKDAIGLSDELLKQLNQ